MQSGKKRRVAILGSTGSVGESAVKVAKCLPDEVEVVGVAANSNIARLAEQSADMGCKLACVGDERLYGELKDSLPKGCKPLAGVQGLLEMASSPDIDMILCAIVGTAGLFPVMEGIAAGKDIALASKEVLVMAGELVMEAASRRKTRLIPVDSEHSAIFQCLEGRDMMDVSKLILTASGGPFRGAGREEMEAATWESALSHPTWDMGPKVTIDSATLMNKALEIVEAHFLFRTPADSIEALVHPQSVIHSMVEFLDGTVLAQMSVPDMRFPIQYAYTYPRKLAGGLQPLDFVKMGQLTFEAPDRRLFPSLDFAFESLRAGGSMPAVMNAANEIAVERFRRGELKLTGIWTVIERTMARHQTLERPPLDAILKADVWARETAASIKA